jgi:NADH-quinone oxidoreductase subunit J
MGADILFYLFAFLMLLCGVMVLISRNPVTSAMFLVLTIASLAGLFVLLHAFFLAAVQVLVYAGAVMVLFLFVIMLVNLERAEKERQFNKQWVVALLASVGLGLLFVWIFMESKALAVVVSRPAAELAEASNTQQVGQLLYGPYMLAFEIASLLLLVAIVGAVVMAKKRI